MGIRSARAEYREQCTTNKINAFHEEIRPSWGIGNRLLPDSVTGLRTAVNYLLILILMSIRHRIFQIFVEKRGRTIPVQRLTKKSVFLCLICLVVCSS